MANFFTSSNKTAHLTSSPTATTKNERATPQPPATLSKSTIPAGSKQIRTARKPFLTQIQNIMESTLHPHKTDTTIIAEIDVGWGNFVSIRGEGGSLSWDEGIQMEYQEAIHSWVWRTDATVPLTFKFLVNDQQWSQGENQTVAAGSTYIGKPNF